MMTLDQFRATGTPCDDIAEALGEDMNYHPGRLYLGCLFIEHWTDDRYGIAPTNGPTWLLTLGNTQPDGDLPDLEQQLYDWAKSEGYFDGDEA